MRCDWSIARDFLEYKQLVISPITATDGKRRLLIINRQQFGYHIDTYYYCAYLRTLFDITYLCWDYGRPCISMKGVEVLYIGRQGAKFKRYMRFLIRACGQVRRFEGITFIKYFPGCTAMKPFGRRTTFVFDIRTGSVVENVTARRASNLLLRLEAMCFKNVTVISEALARALRFSRKRVHVLPLGAEVISASNKDLAQLRLIYVGTLQNRRIEDTIVGLKQFLDNEHSNVDCQYKIIGTGDGGEENTLKSLIHKLGLESVVMVLGHVAHHGLTAYFDKSNIGVSYIPITPAYDVQPPTKTFEYILSGMPVIATATSENKKVISSHNGVLIEATPASFAMGLKNLYQRRNHFDSSQIREQARCHLWENIIQGNLIPYLANL